MKRFLIYWMVLALCLLGGCKKQGNEEEKPVPTAQVAYAAYQYDQGYQLAEGWMYEMTLSSDQQLKELETLLNGVKLSARGEAFEYGRGYRLILRDAAGNITRETLMLDDGNASMGGVIYDADGAEALFAWLDALKIDEQEVE